MRVAVVGFLVGVFGSENFAKYPAAQLYYMRFKHKAILRVQLSL
jgi:hypothetical protein